MSKMTTVATALSEIEEAAQKHAAEPRFVRVVGPDDVVRQGDVYLTLAPDAMKSGAERGSAQVAVGTTVGSRHVATGSVKVLERVDARVLEGPIVEATDRWVLTHPEHAHVSLPAGRYAVHYQNDLTTNRAVED